MTTFMLEEIDWSTREIKVSQHFQHSMKMLNISSYEDLGVRVS